jgi:hypothetical protein
VPRQRGGRGGAARGGRGGTLGDDEKQRLEVSSWRCEGTDPFSHGGAGGGSFTRGTTPVRDCAGQRLGCRGMGHRQWVTAGEAAQRQARPVRELAAPRAVATASRNFILSARTSRPTIPYEFCPPAFPDACSNLDDPVRFTGPRCGAFFRPVLDRFHSAPFQVPRCGRSYIHLWIMS